MASAPLTTPPVTSPLIMAWMYWLLVPAAVVCATAVLIWWANRPRRPLSPARAVRDHRQFLTDLADVTETSASISPASISTAAISPASISRPPASSASNPSAPATQLGHNPRS